MKILFTNAFQITLLLIISLLLISCQEDCEPEYFSYPVTESQRNFIQDQVNDTIKFKDSSGLEYFLICKSIKSNWNGGSSIGTLNNPCEESSTSWENMESEYKGAFFNDQE